MFPITGEMLERIRNYMLVNALSKSEMAQKIGITTPALTNILNRKTHSVRKETFENLRKFIPDFFPIQNEIVKGVLRPWQVILHNFIDGYDPLLTVNGVKSVNEDNFTMLLGLLSYLCSPDCLAFIDSKTNEDALYKLFQTSPNISLNLSPKTASSFFNFLLAEIQGKLGVPFNRSKELSFECPGFRTGEQSQPSKKD